ncbi:MAG: glycosyltransferase [Candidatus Krumholzibacteriia bacterium]
MDVVHIINNLPVGGAERFLLQLAPAQVRLGWRPRVLTLVEPNALAEELVCSGVEHRCMGRRRLNDPRLVLDLRRALRELRPDVVHTHLFYADTFGRVAARAAGVPAIVSTEHSTEGGRLSLRRRTGMRWTAPFAHRIVAVSEAVRRRTAARLGLPASQIRVIPNGIDLEPWNTVEPLPREELRVPADALVVGCVGRVVDAKGYDLLLRAVAGIAEPRLRVLMVGEGPERPSLEEQTVRLGLEEKVRWLRFRGDVPRILKTVDVFALPSRWEGHSVALLEAMAAGCACLISDIPELTETLGEAGVRVQAGDSGSIAAGLRQLLDSAERRAELGAAARQAVRRFSIMNAAQQYADLYNGVLEDVKSRRNPV